MSSNKIMLPSSPSTGHYTSLEEMIQTGMHFGHFTREWNPRMTPYIYGERHGRHILDLVQTYHILQDVTAFLEDQAAQGATFLFVGTKRQAAPLVAETALVSNNSYYVNQRWLGGMLTNWKTIQKSLEKLHDLRHAEEKGRWDRLKKQEIARKRREQARLEKYLGGIEGMTRLPNVVIIVGQPEEIHAVRECRQLGIPIITLVDSNCDPTLADWPIPANDDSIAALRLLLGIFAEAIQKGRQRRVDKYATDTFQYEQRTQVRMRFGGIEDFPVPQPPAPLDE